MDKEKTTIKKKATKKKAVKKAVKYFYAVGRRKASVAQIRIIPRSKSGEGDLVVNERKMVEYFPDESLQATFVSPLKETGMQEKFDVSAKVRGGGVSGQAEAIRLGIARALIKFDEELRAVLKANGFLTRDSRKVERKKPGLKKARGSPQWSKR